MRLRKIACLMLFLFLLKKHLSGLDTGQVQLAVGTPDPVKAGEKITIQILVLNDGSEVWEAGDYKVGAEIYDADKQYVGLSETVKGLVSVGSGETTLVYSSYKVPPDWTGTYYYKIFVLHQNQKVVESNYFSFQITPSLVPRKKLIPLKLGGNILGSYRNGSRVRWNDYTGNMSVNLVGQLFNRTLFLNAYTYHQPQNRFDLRTLLLNYYGSWYNLSGGDVMPVFSSLVASGSGLKGGILSSEGKRFSEVLSAGRITPAHRGSETINGTFARYFLGGQTGVQLPFNLKINANYGYGYDDKESLVLDPARGLNEWGPSNSDLKPATDLVLGGGLDFKPAAWLNMKAEYAQSGYSTEQVERGTGELVKKEQKNDRAYDWGMKFNLKGLALGGDYQYTGPEFVSFGSPNRPKDRQGWMMVGGYNLLRAVDFTLRYNQTSDNLKKDVNKVTTNQLLSGGGLAFGLAGWPRVVLGYAKNRIYGQPREAVNNYTDSRSLGLSYSAGKLGVSLGVQKSIFRDLTGTGNDLDTDLGNLGFNWQLGEWLGINTGGSLSKVKNLARGSNENNTSLSLGLNTRLIKDKLYLVPWLTWNKRKDTLNTVDNVTLSNNLELTYNLTQGWALTLGGGLGRYTDTINPQNSYQDNTVNVRASLSF